MNQFSKSKLPPSWPAACGTAQTEPSIAGNSSVFRKAPSLHDLPVHIQTGLERMLASARQPFPRSYQRLIADNIVLMRDFRAAGARWQQVAEILGEIELPIRHQCLRVMVSRAEREARDAEARGLTERTVPRPAAAAADVGATGPVALSIPHEAQQDETQPRGAETKRDAPERNGTKREETKHNETKRKAKRGETQRRAPLCNETHDLGAKDVEQKRSLVGLPDALRSRALRMDIKPRSR